MRVLRTIFLPWEQHPGMLTAYFPARAAPGFDMYTRVRLPRRPMARLYPATHRWWSGTC